MKDFTLEFRDAIGRGYIKQWPNWDGIIPIVGDIVVLHFGDYNEIEEEYKVTSRRIHGDDSDKIILMVEKI